MPPVDILTMRAAGNDKRKEVEKAEDGERVVAK